MHIVTEKILNGMNVRQALSEVATSSEELDKAVKMVSDWLDFNTYSYKVNSVEPAGVKVSYTEIDPDGTRDNNYFIVKNGKIYNSNDVDVVDISLSLNDDSDELREFVSKWYK